MCWLEIRPQQPCNTGVPVPVSKTMPGTGMIPWDHVMVVFSFSVVQFTGWYSNRALDPYFTTGLLASPWYSMHDGTQGAMSGACALASRRHDNDDA